MRGNGLSEAKRGGANCPDRVCPERSEFSNISNTALTRSASSRVCRWKPNRYMDTEKHTQTSFCICMQGALFYGIMRSIYRGTR